MEHDFEFNIDDINNFDCIDMYYDLMNIIFSINSIPILEDQMNNFRTVSRTLLLNIFSKATNETMPEFVERSKIYLKHYSEYFKYMILNVFNLINDEEELNDMMRLIISEEKLKVTKALKTNDDFYNV